MREQYEIISDPIDGGMGVIYICKSLQYELYLAFKGLNKNVIDSPEAEARLQREAELWLDLAKHPNIVPLRFTCNIKHQKFIVMEAILQRSSRGNTLATWMEKEKKLDIETMLNFSIQICNGMIHATKEYKKMNRTFVHGDLHPGNILIQEKSNGDPIVKITDFGLVRDQETLSQKYMGTLQYTACERWSNAQEIDQRADIYSFGCLVYFMLTGHPPFVFPEILSNDKKIKRDFYYNAHCGDKRDPPLENSGYKSPSAKELNNLVLKCLERNQKNRYSNFNECRSVLVSLYDKFFKKHVEIDENDTKMTAVDYLFRGKSFNGINRPKEAEAAYKKALEIDPKYAIAWNNLGILLADQARFGEAEAAYLKTIELDPKLAYSWSNLGVLVADKGRFDEAEAAYQKALEIDPKYTPAWNNLGVLLDDQGRFDEAEAAYQKALEIEPKYANAWKNS